MIEVEGGRAKTVRTNDEQIDEMKRLWDAMDEEEKELVLKVLNGEGDAVDDAEFIENTHFARKPVDIKTWLSEEYYSGPATASVYPKLKEDLVTIFNGSFFEVILTGSIGWGKSFCAVTGMLYSIYLLTCLKDPHESFGLAPNTPIYFIFLSTTKMQASRTIFQDFQTRFVSIEYFKSINWEQKFHSYSGSFGDWMRFICISSNSTDAIGLNVFGGIMDEVNYGANARIVKDSDGMNSRGRPVTKVEKIYSSVVQRIKSRFMSQGTLPGVLFVISSKNNEMDFTEQRISQSKDDPRVYVMDYAQWDVKPKEQFSGKTFRVFFGGRSLPSRILAEGERPPSTEDPSAEVIRVPVEYKDDFERDIETAIRDIAGKQVPRITPFISKRKAVDWMSKDRDDSHPYETTEWVCGSSKGFKWNLICDRETKTVAGRMEEEWTPKVNPDAPRHVHIDPSINGDATGFVVGHIERWVEVVLKDRDTDEQYKELRPLIYIDLVLSIVAPKNGEIDFSEVRKLIYEMSNRGYKITYVTADSYQSRDSIQQLKKQGYRTDILSLDRTPDGYQKLREALYEKRVRCYNHEMLKHELKNLKLDNATGKVDHPPKGSKDLSDSLAGVVTTLTEVQTGVPSYYVDEDKSKGSQHPLEQWYDASDMMGGNANLFIKG